MIKRLIVKKDGGKVEHFEDLSNKISKINEKIGIEITYVSVAKFSNKQELLIKGGLNSVKKFIIWLDHNRLLIREDLLIPL